MDAPPVPPNDFSQQARQAAALLRALSHETRLLILCHLADQERSVGALKDALGAAQPTLSQSVLSQHLARLRRTGLVATRRAGQTIHYRVADPGALAVIATLARLYCPDLLRR